MSFYRPFKEQEDARRALAAVQESIGFDEKIKELSGEVVTFMDEFFHGEVGVYSDLFHEVGSANVVSEKDSYLYSARCERNYREFTIRIYGGVNDIECEAQDASVLYSSTSRSLEIVHNESADVVDIKHCVYKTARAWLRGFSVEDMVFVAAEYINQHDSIDNFRKSTEDEDRQGVDFFADFTHPKSGVVYKNIPIQLKISALRIIEGKRFKNKPIVNVVIPDVNTPHPSDLADKMYAYFCDAYV